MTVLLCLLAALVIAPIVGAVAYVLITHPTSRPRLYVVQGGWWWT